MSWIASLLVARVEPMVSALDHMSSHVQCSKDRPMSGTSAEQALCTSFWPSWLLGADPSGKLMTNFFCSTFQVLLSCVAGPLVGMHIEQREMASYWMHKKGVTYRNVALALQHLHGSLMCPCSAFELRQCSACVCRCRPNHLMPFRMPAFWTSRLLWCKCSSWVC